MESGARFYLNLYIDHKPCSHELLKDTKPFPTSSNKELFFIINQIAIKRKFK